MRLRSTHAEETPAYNIQVQAALTAQQTQQLEAVEVRI